jgi:hypothetical protein
LSYRYNPRPSKPQVCVFSVVPSHRLRR